MSYRPGNHWGVTIVRSAGDGQERADGDELVAVVVNGDTDIAQRICNLLNSDDEPEHDESFSLLDESKCKAAHAEMLARVAARRRSLFSHPDERAPRVES